MSAQPVQSFLLNLGTSATIRDCAALRETLIAAIADHAHVEVQAADLVEADLTLVQLLVSAGKTAAERGGRLSVRGPLPEVLTDTLERGGFLSPDFGPSVPDHGLWPTSERTAA